MTQEIIEYCKNCAFFNQCAYRKRKVEYLCDYVQAFTNGYETATDKACEYLDKIGHRYVIDGLRKYMEE